MKIKNLLTVLVMTIAITAFLGIAEANGDPTPPDSASFPLLHPPAAQKVDGSYCGNGITQPDFGERCDPDSNIPSADPYWRCTPNQVCGSDCKCKGGGGIVCGDGIVNWPEQCESDDQCDEGETCDSCKCVTSGGGGGGGGGGGMGGGEEETETPNGTTPLLPASMFPSSTGKEGGTLGQPGTGTGLPGGKTPFAALLSPATANFFGANLPLLFVFIAIAILVTVVYFMGYGKKTGKTAGAAVVSKKKTGTAIVEGPARVHSFVKQSLKTGKSKSSIKKELSSVGWKQEIIDKVMKHY